MSDAFWMALFTFLALVVKTVVDGWILMEMKRDVGAVKTNVQIIETATNSTKDAQISLASKLGAAEGEKKGRAEKAAEIKQEAKDAISTPPQPLH